MNDHFAITILIAMLFMSAVILNAIYDTSNSIRLDIDNVAKWSVDIDAKLNRLAIDSASKSEINNVNTNR